MAGQQITCPECGGVFTTEKQEGFVFCQHCGTKLALELEQTPEGAPGEAAAPKAPDGQAGFGPEQNLLEYAATFLDTDILSITYDINLKQAEAKYREALQVNPQSAPAWKGLFDCTLGEVRKTFLQMPKIEDTEFWLTVDSFTSADRYQVDSYFCRALIQQGQPRTFIVDEFLQPGRKAKKYLDSALQYAPDSLREAYEVLEHQYFALPLRALPPAGHRAFLAYQKEKKLQDEQRRQKQNDKKRTGLW